MVIIGVLLLVAAVVVLVDMVVASNGSASVHLFGWHLGSAGPGRMLLLGAAVGVVLTLGLMLVLSGQLRARRKRRERDRTLKGTRAENERLTAQLEAQQAAAAVPEPIEHDSRHHLRRHAHDTVTTGVVDAYPAEARPEGADYVLGSRYPQETSAAHTPPAPPDSRDS